MGRSAEYWQEQQEQEQQAAECEAELFNEICEAIEASKKLGLKEEKVRMLCYASGVPASFFYTEVRNERFQ